MEERLRVVVTFLSEKDKIDRINWCPGLSPHEFLLFFGHFEKKTKIGRLYILTHMGFEPNYKASGKFSTS